MLLAGCLGFGAPGSSGREGGPEPDPSDQGEAPSVDQEDAPEVVSGPAPRPRPPTPGDREPEQPADGDEAGAEQPRVVAEVAASLYVRGDSDGTTVVAPRIRFRQDFGATALDFVYATDVWSSASVDIRTAASGRVEEQRDELDLGLEHERGAWVLGAAYRLSREIDYLAHGPTLTAAWEGWQRNVRLEGRASLSEDQVGRAGDPGFRRGLRTLSTWFAYTQVLGRRTLAQVAGEQRTSLGYHASPYRWVGLGGPVRCAASTPLCIPEVVPDHRHRFALSGRLRQGLSARASLGLGYRYYRDTWNLRSHTALADLRLQARPDLLLSASYRAYFQSGTWFYRSAYAAAGGPRFVTRDRELSPMFNHSLALLLDWTLGLGSAPLELGLGLHIEGIFYGYDDFPGLDQVIAGQGTLNLRLEFL